MWGQGFGGVALRARIHRFRIYPPPTQIAFEQFVASLEVLPNFTTIAEMAVEEFLIKRNFLADPKAPKEELPDEAA